MGQVFIEPVKDFSYPLPLVSGKVARIEKRIGRYKYALWLVGIFVNSSCDETEIHRVNPIDPNRDSIVRCILTMVDWRNIAIALIDQPNHLAGVKC